MMSDPAAAMLDGVNAVTIDEKISDGRPTFCPVSDSHVCVHATPLQDKAHHGENADALGHLRLKEPPLRDDHTDANTQHHLDCRREGCKAR